MKYQLFFLFLVPCLVLAQAFPDDSVNVNPYVLHQEGQFFSAQLIVGKPLRFFVVGKEMVNLDLKNMTVTARQLQPYPGRILKMDRQNNYFTIVDPLDLQEETDLELTTRLLDKTETLHFKIKP